MGPVIARFAFTLIGALLFCLALYIVVALVNRVVQFMAEQLGYEVKDFFSWLREYLPKIKHDQNKNE